MAQTDIVARLLAGDRRALARVVTLIENGTPGKVGVWGTISR